MNYGIGRYSTVFHTPLYIVLLCIYLWEVQIRIKHDSDSDLLLQSLMQYLLTTQLCSSILYTQLPYRE